MPRTCVTVPHSARAGAALLSDGERGTTTRRALEWLRGTVTSGARWLVLRSKQMQNGDESLTNDIYIKYHYIMIR